MSRSSGFPANQAGSGAPEIILDAAAAAREASLRYVIDARPGLSRRRSGSGFRYLKPDGTLVRNGGTLDRIRSLAIPPAWTSVWICEDTEGHLQATGRDARGRKQYRYHPRWRSVRDETKYSRMMQFGEALPQIRRRMEEDLSRPGLPRERVLGVVVRLLETTLIRVGNREYLRANRSFGLTTMRDRHVDIEGSTVRFEFRGKSARMQKVAINDRRLAGLVRKCQEIPGQELFQYYDEENRPQTISSSDVNAYLKEITGQEFTAKDFRTWAGTLLAAKALRDLRREDAGAPLKKNLLRAIEKVAEKLGNTPSVCRKCYVHPAVLDAYMDGVTIRPLRPRADRRSKEKHSRLAPEEAAVLALLKNRLEEGETLSAWRSLPPRRRPARRPRR